MIFFLLLTIFACSITADEVLVQINVNKPLNVISNRFVSFLVDPKIIIENLNNNNSEKLNTFASGMSHSYIKLSSVPLPYVTKSNEISTPALEQELQNWKIFHKWLRSVNWIPVVPLPYSPNGWKSVEALRILNASSVVGVQKCVWQLGSDFDAIGAASYVGDLITLQTMVDAFRNLVEDWGVIGADISSGSDPEETKVYSDLTKHIVDAIGWMQPAENYVPETQNSIIYENDLALKTILDHKAPVWLSISSNSNKAKRLDSWPGIYIADGVQWARTLGDAARTGFNVVYKHLSEEDFFTENLSYFSSLLFKQIMGNKVFDAKVIGGNRFISHVYCHCTKNKLGALSIMAVNIGDNRQKIVTRITSKHTGTELWQYILTSNNKTTYLNGAEIFFNSTMEPFIKVKHPTRPINLTLPPMSIGFWILPLANHNECFEVIGREDERKRTMRIRTSSDLLLQHLIEESTSAVNTNILKLGVQPQNYNNTKQNNLSSETADKQSARRRRWATQYEKLTESYKSRANAFLTDMKVKKDKLRKKRQIQDLNLQSVEKSNINSQRTPKMPTSKNHADPCETYFIKEIFSFPDKDVNYEMINGPQMSEGEYDNIDFKTIQQLMPLLESTEVKADKSCIPCIIYEIYHIRQMVPKQSTANTGKTKPKHQINYNTNNQFRNAENSKLCDDFDDLTKEFDHRELRKILQKVSSNSRLRRDICTQLTDCKTGNTYRRRRSPGYKSIAMANFIAKDMEHDSPNRHYISYGTKKNLIKQLNYDNAPWQNKVDIESGNNFENNNLIDESENLISQEIKNSTDAEEHQPKFMTLFSENVSKFMKMLNHHVTGWWNTWA